MGLGGHIPYEALKTSTLGASLGALSPLPTLHPSFHKAQEMALLKP